MYLYGVYTFSTLCVCVFMCVSGDTNCSRNYFQIFSILVDFSLNLTRIFFWFSYRSTLQKGCVSVHGPLLKNQKSTGNKKPLNKNLADQNSVLYIQRPTTNPQFKYPKNVSSLQQTNRSSSRSPKQTESLSLIISFVNKTKQNQVTPCALDRVSWISSDNRIYLLYSGLCTVD